MTILRLNEGRSRGWGAVGSITSAAEAEDELRSLLSPLRGLIVFHVHPRLAPWAALLRRFAAVCPSAEKSGLFLRAKAPSLVGDLYRSAKALRYPKAHLLGKLDIVPLECRYFMSFVGSKEP